MRPGVVTAEVAEVTDHRVDLRGGQGVAEGRHAAIEAADAAALVHHGVPVHVRFGGREGAVGEVRQGRVEADRGSRRPLAVRAMAGHTRGTIDRLACRGIRQPQVVAQARLPLRRGRTRP